MPPDDAPRRFSLPLATPEVQGAMPAFLRRLAWLLVAVTLLLAFGTAGFVVTEDVSVWRGFVWSLDTVATVGAIPSPLSETGQVVKVVLITLGVGTLFYALVTVTEFFVAGHLGGMLAERRALKMTHHLSGHHLICGFGRVGRQVARDLAALGQPFVVIDRDAGHRELAEQIGAPLIVGMPSDDETLRRAGIERATSVLACVDSDAENIFLTLTARELRPGVPARADRGAARLHRREQQAGRGARRGDGRRRAPRRRGRARSPAGYGGAFRRRDRRGRRRRGDGRARGGVRAAAASLALARLVGGGEPCLDLLG